jgi:hypothetical protein
VGKKQYLIPYFIAAHPGTSDEDMMNPAVWLKRNGFRADQVQTFYPSPMATATAMYHSGKNPLRKVTRDKRGRGSCVASAGRLHKAFLRYHDSNNWPLLREALKTLGRADLIGNGKHHLVPTYQPWATAVCQPAAQELHWPVKAAKGPHPDAAHGLPRARRSRCAGTMSRRA